MRKKVLIIEDDREISELVSNHLEQENFIVFTAFDGEEALQLFEKAQIDLVLLDLMLPKINGMEFLKKIRETCFVPVLIISAKESDVDKTLGLGFGADDYISKPFSVIELTARVHAAIRRSTQYLPEAENPTSNIIQFNALTLELARFSAQVNEKNISLTAKEFQILKLFMQNQNRVFTKEQIYQLIWEDDYFGNENVINVHIRRLREKIEIDRSEERRVGKEWRSRSRRRKE